MTTQRIATLLLRCLFLPIPLIAPTPVSGAEATLRDTIDWLRGSLAQAVAYQHEGRTYQRFLEAQFPTDCSLVFLDRLSGGATPVTWRFETPLAGLDPGNHKIGDFAPGVWALEVRSSGSKMSIIACTATPCEKAGYANSLMFLFHDHDMAPRASKALSHAIRLCGGKVDPF